MEQLVIVVPLRPGTRAQALELVRQGPPFPLAETNFARHEVHLTDREAIFVFEGPDARAAVEEVVGEPGVWKAASEWRACLAERPRIADEAFEWARGG
jgi:hypothetical protein